MALYIEKCIKAFSDFILEMKENTPVVDNSIDQEILSRQKEEKFAEIFFTLMNNALFTGEYLNGDYDSKLNRFCSLLEQIESLFSLQIKVAIDRVRTLRTLVKNKINLTGEDLLFSAMRSYDINEGYNQFISDFSGISIRLAVWDHSLILVSRNDISSLIFISDTIEQRKTISNEQAKDIYDKLQSKCDFLLKKLCYVVDETHKYAIDFEVYDIDERDVVNIHNDEFNSLFECLYNKSNIVNVAREYQKQFRNNRFTSKGFVILSHYYKTHTKDWQQIDNLISRFNKFCEIREKRYDLSDFDKYALECIRLYLYNSRFSARLDSLQYNIELLKEDIKEIKRIQEETQIWNYHPYFKALEFLEKKIYDNSIISDKNYCLKINDVIGFHKELLLDYNKSIDWCSHRKFYPFQLLVEDCISKDGLFYASTFAVPLNVRELNSLSKRFESDSQILFMQSHYINNKSELDKIQDKIKSARKETFEYIGVFIAIITFLFGSLQMFSAEHEWKHAIVNSISLGAILCLFGINISISFNNWNLKCKLLYYAVFIVIALIFIFCFPGVLL